MNNLNRSICLVESIFDPYNHHTKIQLHLKKKNPGSTLIISQISSFIFIIFREKLKKKKLHNVGKILLLKPTVHPLLPRPRPITDKSSAAWIENAKNGRGISKRQVIKFRQAKINFALFSRVAGGGVSCSRDFEQPSSNVTESKLIPEAVPRLDTGAPYRAIRDFPFNFRLIIIMGLVCTQRLSPHWPRPTGFFVPTLRTKTEGITKHTKGGRGRRALCIGLHKRANLCVRLSSILRCSRVFNYSSAELLRGSENNRVKYISAI